MKLLVDIPMVVGLVMLDMDAHMFMLTSLDFLGLNMMVLDVNNRQTKHVFCFFTSITGWFCNMSVEPVQ